VPNAGLVAPAVLAGKLGVGQGKQRFLSPDEVSTLADAIDPRFRALVLTACYAGLRLGELAALRRSRVDLMRRRVEVAETLTDVGGHVSFGPPKTRRGWRTVPIPAALADELAAHMECYAATNEEALVFPSPLGQPLRRTTFRRRVWVPAVGRAGLTDLAFHDLRHTYVSLAASAGLDLYEVSKRAGHSSAAFTADRYAHLYDAADEAYGDAMDRVWSAAQPAEEAEVLELKRAHAGSSQSRE
jgi:integrase